MDIDNVPTNLDFPSIEQLVSVCQADTSPNEVKPTMPSGLTWTPVAQFYFFINMNPGASVRIAKIFKAFEQGGWTFIVTEHIAHERLATDEERANAIVGLLVIKPPSGAGVGPLGGGRMHHIMFKDRTGDPQRRFNTR